LAIHSASTTHSQLSAEHQLFAGATQGHVWPFVSIELIQVNLADLEQDRAAT
tara:strand:+ start:283 stop:438 length:156 start_codon:yes stop_codon:yes gene_type:complete